MLQKNVVTEVPPNSPGFYSNIFLVRKASGEWCPVIDLKSLNAHIFAPHFCMFTTSSVPFCAKRRYSVQDRPAGCVLSCTISSTQHEVPLVCFRKQGLSVPGTSLRSEQSHSDFYSLGAHGDGLPPSSRDFGYSLSTRLAGLPPRPSSLVTTSGPAFKDARPGWVYSKQKEIRADIQFLRISSFSEFSY